MISSAQVVRDLQQKFQPSELFAPWLSNAKMQRERENHNQRQRRKQKEIKVKIGHGGTLDPLATGVLIMGVGSGTKSLQDFLLCTKTYEAVVLFGTGTDSYDRVGKVLKRAPYEHITQQMVEDALGQFRGKFMQLPPLFSALKMNGKPLYEYAREGKMPPREIERRSVECLDLQIVEWMEGGTHEHVAPSEDATPAEINVANRLWKQEGAEPGGEYVKDATPLEEFESKKRKLSESADDLVKEQPASRRKVDESDEAKMSGGLAETEKIETTVTSIENEDIKEPAVEDSTPAPVVKGPPAARIRMTVTSGFYVRSLCHDLGAAVGSAALMAELERTRQGDFEVGKNALEYEDLVKGEDVWGPKVSQFLDDWYEKEKLTRVPFQKRSLSPQPKKNESETKSLPKTEEPTTTEGAELEAGSEGVKQAQDAVATEQKSKAEETN